MKKALVSIPHILLCKNLHDELILANEQPENIDISIQDEMDSKVATESVGVNVKQGYSKGLATYLESLNKVQQ